MAVLMFPVLAREFTYKFEKLSMNSVHYASILDWSSKMAFKAVVVLTILIYSEFPCSAQTEDGELLLESTTKTIDNFVPTQIPFDDKIQQGLRDLQLRILKQRTEMVLYFLKDNLPQLLAIQAKIEEMLKMKVNSLDSGKYLKDLSSTMAALSKIEDKSLPKEKLNHLHSLLFATSTGTLRTGPKIHRRFPGSLQGLYEDKTPDLNEVSHSILGRSWAVEIKNSVDAEWTLRSSVVIGAYLSQEIGAPVLSSQATKVFGFTVTNTTSKIVYVYQLKSAPISFAFGIRGVSETDCIFGMDFISNKILNSRSPGAENLPPLKLKTFVIKSSDGNLTLNNTVSGVTNSSMEGYDLKAVAQMMNIRGKLQVSITLLKQ